MDILYGLGHFLNALLEDMGYAYDYDLMDLGHRPGYATFFADCIQINYFIC